MFTSSFKFKFLKRVFFPAFFIAAYFLAAASRLAAAEFEAVDNLRVGAYAVIQGSADVQGAGFSVGGSSFAVSYGKIGIGTAAPAALLHISSAAGAGGDLVLISTGSSDVIRMTGGGGIYAAKYYGGVLQGLAAPASADAAANKAYVDAFEDTCALGSALVSDIAGGKTADINCDGIAEVGTSDALPSPEVGGSWVFVPGNPALGTRGFYIQKYEAKNVSSVPTSQPSGSPWVSLTQIAAKSYCESLGVGYHLFTMEEALTISRNIENNGWNWTGGSVGSGGLWRGHSDNSPGNALAADVSGDPDDDPYVGTGNTSPSIEKRVHQLNSGQYIWDWSGNVAEWVDMSCTPGAGLGNWYAGAAWIEWSDSNLSDYEKGRAGPAGAYTSAQNTGKYFGCTAVGKVGMWGLTWVNTTLAGIYGFSGGTLPTASGASLGFRCAR